MLRSSCAIRPSKPLISLISLRPDIIDFLTVVAAVAGVAATWISWRQLQLSRADVHIQVRFKDPDLGTEVEIRQRGDQAMPFDIDLVALNLGGTRSAKGRITVTLTPGYRAVISPDWKKDTPNAMMPSGSEAVACAMPRIERNGRASLPTLRIIPRDLTSPGRTLMTRCTLRWETWIQSRGANSDDLQIKIVVN